MLAGMVVGPSARGRTGNGSGTNVPGGNVHVMYVTKAKASPSVLWSDVFPHFVQTANFPVNNVEPSHATSIGQFMDVIVEDSWIHQLISIHSISPCSSMMTLPENPVMMKMMRMVIPGLK